MTNQSVLIVDDEPDIRELLEITLLRMGLDTYSAGNVKDAILCLQEQNPDLCLTDMKLPDGNGVDIVNYIQRNMPATPVAVITAFGSMETAVEALKAGAFDFVSKPVDLKKLRELIELSLNSKNKKANLQHSQRRQAGDESSSGLILGESKAIQLLKQTIKKLARSHAPVYIYGESGSGKELVAKSIHQNGPQASAPFIPVNCGAIPENLMESEFFGHKKGSFSGAIDDKQGLFQAANKGTLFLDEVADLPMDMQVKLLRAIQEKAIKPVGGTEEIPVDIRVLSATHKNLEAEVANHNFRQDLYYRLNVIKLEVPPLRNRDSDILLLADHFLQQTTERWGMDSLILSDVARIALRNYAFPGNVRELVNILERASTLCENNIIEEHDLQLPQIALDNEALGGSSPIKSRVIENVPVWEKGLVAASDERKIILDTLERTHWNRTRAAKLLGMSLRQLRYRIEKYELEDCEQGSV